METLYNKNVGNILDFFLTVLSACRLHVTLCEGEAVINSIGMSRGGGQGVLTPPFLDPPPPFSSVTPPPPTQPDLTDKCNVNCFLIV